MAAKLAALALTLSAGACAVNPHANVNAFAQRTDANSFEAFGGALRPRDALVLPVLHDRQTEGASCGAHALATVLNYWNRADTVAGRDIFAASPPASAAGYSMAELVTLAERHDLIARAVRLPEAAIIEELERGRPVLTPVRVPAIYLQRRALPGRHLPLVGLAGDSVIDRTGRFAEFSSLGLVDHYLLVVGHQQGALVVVEPILGFRTISSERFQRYRGAFGNAAIVFSRRTKSP
jgi:hypothetical protein